MKYNLLRSTLTLKSVILLFVLFIYNFFFVDEELLVSLITIFVLVSGYSMFSNNINEMFMVEINNIFRKLNVFMFMDLKILTKSLSQFINISIYFKHATFFVLTFYKIIKKLYNSDKFFVTLTNYVVHNISVYVVTFKAFMTYLLYIRILPLTNFLLLNNYLLVNNLKFKFKLRFLRAACLVFLSV